MWSAWLFKRLAGWTPSASRLWRSVLREPRPLVGPLYAKAAPERTVRATTLRLYIGNPRWSRWKRLCGSVGVPTSGRRLTRAECRLVMEAWYRELGEFRLKRWRAQQI